jgi:hypothetical protein
MKTMTRLTHLFLGASLLAACGSDSVTGDWTTIAGSTEDSGPCMPDVLTATIDDSSATFQLDFGLTMDATIAMHDGGFTFVDAATRPDEVGTVYHLIGEDSSGSVDGDTLRVTMSIWSEPINGYCTKTFAMQR